MDEEEIKEVVTSFKVGETSLEDNKLRLLECLCGLRAHVS